MRKEQIKYSMNRCSFISNKMHKIVLFLFFNLNNLLKNKDNTDIFKVIVQRALDVTRFMEIVYLMMK